MTGRVATGAQRGRMIGFPTANLADIPTLIPRDGVYAVRVRIPAESLGADSKVFAGAANFGPNPTFGEDSRKVEVHLLEFSGDLYGQILAVDLVARLRDTQRFAAVEDLLRQLRRDVEQARARAHAEDGDV
jgi:riboflavin kinase/FMN adenylyltransferase